MPDIVGKLVVVEMVVKNIDPHTDCYCPLTALEPHTQDEISFIYKSKLAVLDDEI